MPQSLAFAAPVPAYVYQNVAFEVSVKLVDEHKAKVAGSRQGLHVSLRFHDTYDLVDAQDAELVLTSPASLSASSGTSQLSLSLRVLSAACDGRAFCLEVRSDSAAVESVFSSAVSVVKEKLSVETQPPDVWFKDEGGREKCMTVSLALTPAPDSRLEDRVVPLAVRLLYESGNPVLNQRILRLFPDMRPNMAHGRATIAFRIDDVSKNHQGQSFVLEIAPERQDGSSMFQDIAPTRTSVIAIRSKRNKRKLNAAAAAASSASYGARASPRSVAGTPRNNLGPGATSSPLSTTGMLLQPHPQRARKYQATTGGSGGYGMMPSVSWSSHLLPPASGGMTSQPPQHLLPPQPQIQMATPTNTAGAVEWALGGFEIHPDGAMNTSRPIYRCPQCRRLNDVDMLAAGPAVSHNPQCVFAPTAGDGLLYPRSQLEGAPLNQNLQQPQMQRGYASYQTSGERGGYDAALNMQQNSVNISSAMGATGSDDASPTTLAALAPASSTQRPALTISPFMNKVSTDAMGNDPQQTTTPSSGNLFESNAFHNQMELGELGGTEKLAFLSKASPEEDDPALDPAGTSQAYDGQEESGAAAFGGVGGMSASLFNEMTSMGISLDQFDKGETLLSDFGGLEGEASSEEDQVFYILARMYTDEQSQKLGLPAFDQFQRMLGFYSEAQSDVQTQVVFHPLRGVGLAEKERVEITSQFLDELSRDSEAVHSLPKYNHNLIMLREDALMFYWSQSLV